MTPDCDLIKNAIPLYLYGELSAEVEENVEAHLEGCPSCAKELAVQREFARGLNEHELQPSLDLLVECRRSLAAELGNQEAAPQRKWLAAVWDRVFGFPVNNFRIPAGAMAMFALGWFAARTPQFLPGLGGGANQAGLVSTVRSIEPDRAGRIVITVEDAQRREVSGSLEDGKIRELLLTGLHEESNPGVRVESVSVLKDLASSEDVRVALLDALQHDPNPGVRLKAIEGLHEFSYDRQVRQTLTGVLMSDSNPGVRIQAIDLLTSRHDDSIVGVLQSLVHKDDNDYVRLRCVRALQDMNASVGSF